MDNFQYLLDKVAVTLKAYGYAKKGNTCYREKDGNQGLIDFQKSRDKPPAGISFTINAGVFSTELWNRSVDPVIGKPDISMCQWRKRLGFLMPEKKDIWWLVTDDMVIDPFVAQMEKLIIDLAIPAIETHISDRDLAEAWLRKESGGLTDYTRLNYLITILKLNNDPRLPEAVSELKASAKTKTMEYSIKELLKDLKIE